MSAGQEQVCSHSNIGDSMSAGQEQFVHTAPDSLTTDSVTHVSWTGTGLFTQSDNLTDSVSWTGSVTQQVSWTGTGFSHSNIVDSQTV